jgi:hypothetical protein
VPDQHRLPGQRRRHLHHVVHVGAQVAAVARGERMCRETAVRGVPEPVLGEGPGAVAEAGHEEHRRLIIPVGGPGDDLTRDGGDR